MAFEGTWGVSVWGLPGQGEVFILPSQGDDKKQTDSFIIVFMFSTDNVPLAQEQPLPSSLPW